MNLSLLRQRRDEILAAAEKCGAENVRVFGSVARGEETGASDVDFLVRWRDGASLMDAARLWRKLKDMLGVEVDVVSERTVPAYAGHIFEEAVPL